MTFMETMKEGTADQVFEKLFPIVGAVVDAYVIALLAVWFIVGFGAMIGMLFISVGVIIIIFIAVMVTGCVAEGISDLITECRE